MRSAQYFLTTAAINGSIIANSATEIDKIPAWFWFALGFFGMSCLVILLWLWVVINK